MIIVSSVTTFNGTPHHHYLVGFYQPDGKNACNLIIGAIHREARRGNRDSVANLRTSSCDQCKFKILVKTMSDRKYFANCISYLLRQQEHPGSIVQMLPRLWECAQLPTRQSGNVEQRLKEVKAKRKIYSDTK